MTLLYPSLQVVLEMKVFPLMEVLAIGTQTTLRWLDPRKEEAASQLHSEKFLSAEKCRRREEDSIAGRHGLYYIGGAEIFGTTCLS